MTQCAAPNDVHEQCTNLIEKGSKFHCHHHRVKSHKLYIRYKKICDMAQQLHLQDYLQLTTWEEQIKFLTRCLYIFQRAYNARLEHRKYSFVRSFYDGGHNYQFYKLHQQSKKCETLIVQVCHEKNKKILCGSATTINDSTLDISSETLNISNDIKEEALNKVHSFQKQRHAEEQLLKKEMKLYKSQYNIEQSKKQHLVAQLTAIFSNIVTSKCPFTIAILLQVIDIITEFGNPPTNRTYWLTNKNKKMRSLQDYTSFELSYYKCYFETNRENKIKTLANLCNHWQYEPNKIPVLYFENNQWLLQNKTKPDKQKWKLEQEKLQMQEKGRAMMATIQHRISDSFCDKIVDKFLLASVMFSDIDSVNLAKHVAQGFKKKYIYT